MQRRVHQIELDWQVRISYQTLSIFYKRNGILKMKAPFRWRTPTTDLLNDRGLMGEGSIPIRRIRGWVEAAGFRGFNEVEIFSNRLWAGDQDEFLGRITRAYREHV